MNKLFLSTTAAVLFGVSAFGGTAVADHMTTRVELPLDLALQAAKAAVDSCEASGYHISTAVVDMNGNEKVRLKGDHSTIHTKDTAYRKAYTLVTLGPIFKFSSTSEAAAKMNKSPHKDAFLTVPGITPLPGAIAIKAKGQIIAAIGVGGAPGGDKDEACALAGVKAIEKQLQQL